MGNSYERKTRIRKISVKLQGGVGNQLFQLAAGLYHAKIYSKELAIDFSLVSNLRHHGSTVEQINLFSSLDRVGAISVGAEPQGSGILSLNSRRFRIESRLQQSLHRSIVQTSHVGFDSRLERLQNLTLIQGYFQSYYYFDQLISSRILDNSDFLSQKLSEQSLLIAKYIDQNNPVILHVRAGDYLTLSDSIGVLSHEYFAKVLKIYPWIRDRKILLFTDDPPYAESVLEGLPIKYKFFMESLNIHPMELISVMSGANDFVISNSTFSWWAARLSKQRGQIIAPEQWFKARHQPLKLIPPNWGQVQSSFLESTDREGGTE